MITECPDFWLDHVALVTPDLDRAYEVYSRMGFNLSPRSSHQGQLEADGPIELWGAGNHCAMFSAGYLEILGITDPDRYCEHVQVLLDNYSGLHLIALGCADIERQIDILQRNLGEESTCYDVSRAVPLVSGGSKEATFRILQLPDETFPEADLFFIEHKNTALLWQPELLTQPNGVIGLSKVIVCSDASKDAAERLSAALGITPAASGDARRFSLAHGEIEITTPEAVARRFFTVTPPVLPWVGAVEFAVTDIDSTYQFLQEGQFDLQRLQDGAFWLHAEGAVVVFRQGQDSAKAR